LKEKVKVVVSEKASIDVDERANQLIVTDYNDNLRLMGELIRELDVASVSDTVIEIYSLKFSQADDLANLLGLILNAQSAAHRHPRSLHSCRPALEFRYLVARRCREAGRLHRAVEVKLRANK